MNDLNMLLSCFRETIAAHHPKFPFSGSAAASEFHPSGLRPMPCQDPSDCGQNVLQGAYCDLEYMACACKPDYPVTDSRSCYKGR